MNDIITSLLKLLNSLDEHQVEYILIGGFAVAFQGVERFTQDIDLFVKNDPGNFDKLKQSLRSVYDDKAIDEINVNDDYPVIRYGTPDQFYIDIMVRIGEVFNYEDLEYEEITRQGVKIRIATSETLIKLKKNTIRYQDRADVDALQSLLEKRKKK